MATLTPVSSLQIPLTDTRSKALITIQALWGGYNPLQYTNPTAAMAAGNIVTIGTAQKLTLKSKRGTSYARVLQASTLGRPQEVVPGLIDFDGCSISNLVTYQQDFIQACGFSGGFTPDWQGMPLMFFFLLPTPDPTYAPIITLRAEKAWVENNDYEFDVTNNADVKMVQNIDLNFSNIAWIPTT